MLTLHSSHEGKGISEHASPRSRPRSSVRGTPSTLPHSQGSAFTALQPVADEGGTMQCSDNPQQDNAWKGYLGGNCWHATHLTRFPCGSCYAQQTMELFPSTPPPPTTAFPKRFVKYYTVSPQCLVPGHPATLARSHWWQVQHTARGAPVACCHMTALESGSALPSSTSSLDMMAMHFSQTDLTSAR